MINLCPALKQTALVSVLQNKAESQSANVRAERADNPQANWSPSEVVMCKSSRFLIV